MYIPIYQHYIILPPRYGLSPHHDITNDCISNLIPHNQPSHLSHLTTTNQVDTDRKNDDETQYFATPRNQYHSTPEIHETTTTTNPVWPNVHSHLCQNSSSTSTASSKLLPSGKEYLCFQIYGKYYRAAQCAKSRVLNKAIDLITDIE